MNENQQRRMKHGDRPAPGSLKWDEGAESNSAHAAEAAQPASTERDTDDLHNAIMNLSCDASPYDHAPNERLAYKIGHRDARHAAAGLVSEFASRCRVQGGNTSENGRSNFTATSGEAPADAELQQQLDTPLMRIAVAWKECGFADVKWGMMEDALRAASPATASGDDLPTDLAYLVEYVPHTAARRALASKINESIRAAVSAATKPTADLSKLTRYEPIFSHEEGSQMAVASSGQWFHVEDIQSLLPTKPAAPAVPEDERQDHVLPPTRGTGRLLNANELAALRRFDECAQDGEGYDVPKEMMQRLAEIGVVRRTSGSYYEHTDFGQHVLGNTPPPSGPYFANEGREPDWDGYAAGEREADIAKMVNRFLGWPLPAGLRPDIERPIGTHMLNADQAHAMFDYVLAAGAARQGGNTNNNDAGSKSDAVIEAREQALEDAAKLMDPFNEEGTVGAANAERIRALKRTAAGAEGAE